LIISTENLAGYWKTGKGLQRYYANIFAVYQSFLSKNKFSLLIITIENPAG
jgi:hypothetical protein